MIRRTFRRQFRLSLFHPESFVSLRSPHAQRLRSGVKRRRALIGSTAAAALAALVIAPVAAHSEVATNTDVRLTSVFAAPIVADPYAADATKKNKLICTPDPNGKVGYGTDGTFDPAKPLSTPVGRDTGWPAWPGIPSSEVAPYPASTGPATYVPANLPSRDELVQDRTAGVSNDLCFGFTLPPDMQKEIIYGPANSSGRLPDASFPDLDSTHLGTTVANSGDALKNVSIDMPAGFSGEVDGAPTCSTADFGADNYKAIPESCLAAQIGTAFVRIDTQLFGSYVHLVNGGEPNPTTGGFGAGVVYNIAHGPNELGRLGISVQPVGGLAPAKFTVRLLFTPDGSGRIRTVVENAPNKVWNAPDIDAAGQPKSTAVPIPLYVESVGIRAWGKKADHPTLTKDFTQWGTDCSTDLVANASIETYDGKTSSAATEGFKLTGCESLEFKPSVKVETTEHKPSVPTGATVTVGLDQTTSNGKLTALLKDAAVTLPGLEIGAQAGSKDGGLKLCTAAQFNAAQPTVPSTCPVATETGSVSIISPLQTLPFEGKVYLGAQPAVGELPNLYLEVAPKGATSVDAPRIKLTGTVAVDADGRLTTTFKDAPQLRFSSLALTFAGGDNALFVTPRTCGDYTSTSQFTSSAVATPKAVVSNTLSINEDCATPGFAPTISMAADDQTVGASSPTTVKISRQDRSPWLKGIKVSLPAGFLSNLKVVSECASADAAAGTCPESSRIGSVRTLAGVGPKPLALEGKMYLAQREEGSVAGAVIVVHAQIGDIDLGNVVVPAKIDLRPTDAGLALTTSTPLRFKGLALNLQEVTVRLDREGFPLNPTACGPLTATGDFTGDADQLATSASQITYSGCAARPFQPGLAASLSGDTKLGGHPDVHVTMTPRPGDSNIKSTTVVLPTGVASDLNNLKVTCPLESFNASSCPESVRVGNVTANVSITDDTIAGGVYLVKVPGQSLPGLGLSFTGRYAQRVLSVVKIDPTGRLTTVFDSIPDLPLTKLQLDLAGGPKGPIQLTPKACTANSSWDATFGGQGGQSAKASIAYPCALPPQQTIKWSRKKGLSFTFSVQAGKTIKSAKLTMPKGFKLKTTKAGKKAIKIKATGSKVKSKITSKGISITPRTKTTGPTKITVTIGPKAITLPKAYKGKVKKGKKIKVKLRTAASDGKVASATTTVKAT